MPIEMLVRPFQAPSNVPPARELGDVLYQVPVHLQVGPSGSGKVMEGSYHMDAKTYKDMTTKETSSRA